MMKSKLNTLLLFNTFILLFFNFAHPVTPEMLLDKGVRASSNGFLFALMGVGMAIGSYFWAKKLDKIKSNQIIIICLVGYGLSQIIFGFSPNLLGMSIGRLIAGSFAGGWIVISTEYINQHTDENNKIKYLAYLLASNAVAAVLGQLSSGLLGDNIWIYYIFIFQLIGLSLIALFVPKNIENLKRKSHTDKVKKTNVKLNSHVLMSLVIILLFSLAFTAYNSQIGYFISDIKGATTLQVGIVNSFTNVVMFITNVFIITAISKKIRARYIILLQAIIGIIGMTLLIDNIHPLIPIGIFLLGVVGYKPVIQRYTIKQQPDDSIIIISFLNSFNSIGLVLGSVFSGFLYVYNPIYVIYLIALSLVLIVILQGISLIKK